MPPKSDIPNNAEIDQALKDFEIKSQIEQMQKSPETSKNSDVPKMTRLVMKWFKIDQKQTEYVLLGFVVVAIGISLFLFTGATRSNSKPPVPSITGTLAQTTLQNQLP